MYKETTVWAARIIDDHDEWTTKYMEDKWDDYTFYATRDLAMEAIWKATIESYGLYDEESIRDPRTMKDIGEYLDGFCEIGRYNHEYLEEVDGEMRFREDLRYDEWPYPHTFECGTIDGMFVVSLDELIVQLPPEE